MELTSIQQALTLLGTGGGVWAVVMLFRWFQRDFAAVYRRELAAERERADTADRLADAERATRIKYQLRISRLEHELVTNGIEVPEGEQQ